MDLQPLAEDVGTSDEVTIAGSSSRGGPVPGVRCVNAPSGIDWIQADEMIVQCGAGTSMDDLAGALRDVGQRVVLPDGGTVGGALTVGRSGTRRLGDGPLRDALLQARYIGADGSIVKAGGPTVKNVSGFDVCRLLVGSRGTLGFLGEVILRTRPLAACAQWFTAAATDPFPVFRSLFRPVSVLWDGSAVWALLEGHADDVREQAVAAGLVSAVGPPPLPGHRIAVQPAALDSLRGAAGFVAEVGVGVVHAVDPSVVPAAARALPPSREVIALQQRIKSQFDPTGRLNPGVVVG